MKFVTYNIQWSKGKDGRLDLARIARAVDGADVICLQEVESGWRRTGNADQSLALAALLPRYYWVYGPGYDLEASIARPDGTIEHRRRRFGNMTLARGPILSTRTLPLRKIDVRKLGSMHTAAVEAVVRIGAATFRVYNVHLDDVLQRERLLQIEDLYRYVFAAPVEGGAHTGHRDPADPFADEDWSNGEADPPMPRPAVLMGDFNLDPAWAEYDAMVGPRDVQRGRVVTPDRFVDAMLAAGHPEDCGATWYPGPQEPELRPLRLDYCFVTHDLAGAVRKAWIDQDADGSDHQPVWTEIEL